jgi:hypothetical protein
MILCSTSVRQLLVPKGRRERQAVRPPVYRKLAPLIGTLAAANRLRGGGNALRS